jgi:hypothetical protein
VCHVFALKQPPVLYKTGLNPQAVVAEDLNHDGHLDLAITNYGASSISILLGVGNGSFPLPALTFSCNGTNPYWLVARDFNQDGNLDLAMCNEGSNTVSVLLGQGNGSFQLAAKPFASGGPLPSGITAADFDKDNKTDLALTNTGNGTISIFLGLGNGTFKVPGKSYPAGMNPSSITNGDFNADGNIDLAVASRHSNQLFIFLGIGNGTFQTNSTTFTTGLNNPYSVKTADFNGDLKLDLVVANFGSNTISIFLGTGTGTFVVASPATYATGGSSPIDVTIADLNGDSKMDLAVSNQAGNNVTVFLGNGNGTFGQQQTYLTNGQQLQAVIAADLNEDGKNDLVVVNQNNNTVAILLTQCA